MSIINPNDGSCAKAGDIKNIGGKSYLCVA